MSLSPKVHSLHYCSLSMLYVYGFGQMDNDMYPPLYYCKEQVLCSRNPLCLRTLYPHLTPGNHWSFHCLHSLVFSRMSYDWNCAACSVWHLSLGDMHLKLRHLISILKSVPRPPPGLLQHVHSFSSFPLPFQSFPGGSDGKESACNAKEWVQSLGQEDPPEEGIEIPPQYSHLENPMDRGAWLATVHGVSESDMIERLTLALPSQDLSLRVPACPLEFHILPLLPCRVASVHPRRCLPICS